MAAAAARLGLGCTLVLRGEAPPAAPGNLLLDRFLGAEVRWSGTRDVTEMMPDVAHDLRRDGRKPCATPTGGSNGVGCVGYACAFEEAMEQFRSSGTTPDCVVVPVGSGGAYAGMLFGAHTTGYKGRVADRRHGGAAPPESAIDVRNDVSGPPYATPTERDRDAIERAARNEWLLLDPAYTPRAFAGLIAMVRSSQPTSRESVVFWHTGGSPGLLAYADRLWDFTSVKQQVGLETADERQWARGPAFGQSVRLSALPRCRSSAVP
jgi:1-aminocyclopropane-1-carboxylate deaminase/D-cysteine desulfhydrase-like pyridoxal-dependent ACC family enzyme